MDDPGVYSVTVPVVGCVVLVSRDIVDVDGLASPDDGLKLVVGDEYVVCA